MPALTLIDKINKPNENMGGATSRILIGLLADALTIPVNHAKDVASSITEWVTLETPPVMKTGKKMVIIQASQDTVEIKHDPQGETDCASFKNLLEFFVPGYEKESLALAAALLNNDVFIIVEQGGQFHMLGNKEQPCNSDGTGGATGKKAADSKGTTFKFKWNWSTPVPIVTMDETDVLALLAPAV